MGLAKTLVKIQKVKGTTGSPFRSCSRDNTIFKLNRYNVITTHNAVTSFQFRAGEYQYMFLFHYFSTDRQFVKCHLVSNNIMARVHAANKSTKRSMDIRCGLSGMYRLWLSSSRSTHPPILIRMNTVQYSSSYVLHVRDIGHDIDHQTNEKITSACIYMQLTNFYWSRTDSYRTYVYWTKTDLYRITLISIYLYTR